MPVSMHLDGSDAESCNTARLPLFQSSRILDFVRGRRLCHCRQADHIRLAEIVLKLFPEASSPSAEDCGIWCNPIQRWPV